MTGEHRQENTAAEEQRVVVRDRRRIDPETGEVRMVSEDVAEDGQNASSGGRHAAPTDGTVEESATNVEATLQAELEERTADLKRLQAEYANYRKRVDRDRDSVITAAKAQVASELLAVLDDVDRAAAHGDLTGAFKAVADKLVAALHRVGLESFGHEGEEFDPSVHEAVQHATSPDVSGPTVTAVLRRGYKFGDRMVRAALVAVTDHEPEKLPEPEIPEADSESASPIDWFESPAGEKTNEQI